MDKLAVAFTGPSDSGKTTLIIKIAEILVKTKRVAIVKNDPGDKARFDVQGKDSYKFFATGADVVVTSPTRTTVFRQNPATLDEIVSMLGEFDLLLVEGLKTLPLPRIGVFRQTIDEAYLPHINALAVDGSVDTGSLKLDASMAVLDLNDPESVIKWIEKNAKELP